jgi:hypothetical protein
LSASATRYTSSPVRGSSTGKVLPLTASTHSPPMNSCRRRRHLWNLKAAPSVGVVLFIMHRHFTCRYGNAFR